jgi:hypothetical protein
VIVGLGAFAAARTGEGAEEVVSELGALALIALAIPSRLPAPKRAAAICSLVLATVTFGLVARAANLGGAIRHPEIGAAPAGALEGHETEDWKKQIGR